MLVRRMATVTISAPLASTARRVSSKSRYLPVPMSRRERYALPAMFRVSAADTSASSHGHDDFKLVAVGERGIGVAAARHDLPVALHRHLFPGQRQFGKQAGD